MFNWVNRRLRAFTILEFLVVVVLSGIVITTAMYLMTFFQTGLEKKIHYEAAITDIMAFENILHQDFHGARLLELDGFGNLMVKTDNQVINLYAQRNEDYFRNSTSLDQIYNFTLDRISYYFEGVQVDRESLVDYMEINFFDTYDKPHKLSFFKEFGRADLYNHF